MFGKIFKFEIQYWLRSPLWYTYLALMFLLAGLIAASSVGVFDDATASVVGITMMNSPLSITDMLGGLTFFIYFLLPSIIGSSIYKDYKSEMFQVLFSYPFTKLQYLLAKFLSSFLITLLIVMFASLGLMAGFNLPGANEDLLLEFDILYYLQPFAVVVIPNLLFYGIVVFGVVSLTRNIFIGFITVLILLVVQGLSGMYLEDLDMKTLGALLDPIGGSAIYLETQYWTIEERNTRFLPLDGYILYNRLLWSAVSLLIFFGIFSIFKFDQNPISLNIFKKKSQRFVKQNFGGYSILRAPEVKMDFSTSRLLKNVWRFAAFELRFILKNWAFISIFIVGLLVAFLSLNNGYKIQGTETLPVTRIMVSIGQSSISLFMMILIFLFSGMLIHRGNIAKMDQLLDTTAQPSWVFMASKFLAILELIVLINLSVILLSMIVQAMEGFYDFEIGLYLFDYFLVEFPNWIIFALLAFFVHSLLKNYIVGFISLIILTILFGLLSSFGIEQPIFRFNQISGASYSDMTGYGHSLGLFYVYKIYWGLFGIALIIIASLFYQRGLVTGFRNRLSLARHRFSTTRKLAFSLSLLLFIGLGSYIYYVNNVENERYTGKEMELARVEYERQFGHYKEMEHPRIIASKIHLDLFPETRDYKLQGTLTLKNTTDSAIDSVFLRTDDDLKTYSFSIPTKMGMKNERYDFEVLHFERSLQPGEELTFNFTKQNEPNTLLRNNSPVQNNGTFLNNNMLPSFGYNEYYEISYHKLREKYGLPFKSRMRSPHNQDALNDSYISSEADWIDFEATISTSPEQIAIAPGYLQKEWTENARRYFHYKMEDKMLNFYNLMSAEYEVFSEKHEDIDIQIFYHPSHDYNLERMMQGAKESLSYYQDNFGPYQFRQLRIIEFPSTQGSFAQSFANTVPFSEGIGFIANVDEEDEGVDYPFTVTAHEVAHQWWGHQVVSANVQGATVMSESLSEYSSLKVLEQRYGEQKMRRFLKDALDKYLSGRGYESSKEQPLIYNENSQYIHYNKGSLVMYALSDYLGTKNFNNMLSRYIDSVAFKGPPYTTSLEFTEHVRRATPDSLQYLVYDLMETISLYNNRITKHELKELENGKYEVTLSALVLKYQTQGYGETAFEDHEDCMITYTPASSNTEDLQMKSLPLKDYIEIGIFSEDEKGNEKVLYLKKHKITEINNQFIIEVDEKPTSVGIDPYNKLIDRNSDDNRMKI